jgi:hypothetical protein
MLKGKIIYFLGLKFNHGEPLIFKTFKILFGVQVGIKYEFFNL